MGHRISKAQIHWLTGIMGLGWGGHVESQRLQRYQCPPPTVPPPTSHSRDCTQPADSRRKGSLTSPQPWGESTESLGHPEEGYLHPSRALCCFTCAQPSAGWLSRCEGPIGKPGCVAPSPAPLSFCEDEPSIPLLPLFSRICLPTSQALSSHPGAKELRVKGQEKLNLLRLLEARQGQSRKEQTVLVPRPHLQSPAFAPGQMEHSKCYGHGAGSEVGGENPRQPKPESRLSHLAGKGNWGEHGRPAHPGSRRRYYFPLPRDSDPTRTQ